MVEVCFVGQAFWVERLAALLNLHGEGRITACSTNTGAGQFFYHWKHLLTADVIIRLGFPPLPTTPKARRFDLMWGLLRRFQPNRRVIYYWIGSEVQQTVERLQALPDRGPLLERLARDRHITGAPWFVDELATVGLEAQPVLFPSALPHLASVPPMPERLTVLSYLPEANYAYYGGEALYEAARRMPDVEFEIVGGEGAWVPAPLPNLHFRGWQKDLHPFYSRASAVVRMVPHDAIGATVREGMAYGRHVAYTYAIPFTRALRFGDVESLVAVLEDWRRQHLQGSLALNSEARDYALAHFDEARNARDLADYVLQVARSQPGENHEERS